MADLTDEELDRARIEEAKVRASVGDGAALERFAAALLTIEREGWTPPKPVDPDLIEAREIAATANDQQYFYHTASAYRGGTWDSSIEVQVALTAIKQTKAKFAAVLDDVQRQTEAHIGSWVFARIREKAGL